MLTLIGDVHGKYSKYLEIIPTLEYSVQLGDFGFNYSRLMGVDPTRHRIIGGNHDNYAVHNERFFKQTPHFLGDFGCHTLGNVNFFFVRGGRSIDNALRSPGIDWWVDEELTYKNASKALTLYKQVKPDIVLSHECPESVIDRLPIKKLNVTRSLTSQMLQAMFEAHKPAKWYFGHYHVSCKLNVDGTTFQCLNELETVGV